MTKLYLLIGLQIVAVATSYAQKATACDTSRKYAADTVVKGIKDIVQELAIKHPGFYRYHTPSSFTHYIDSTNSTITDSLTELQVYRKLKPIISRIGCLHTGLKLTSAYSNYLDSQHNLIPLQLYFLDQRAFIVQNFTGNPALLPGVEIVRINNRSIGELLQILLPAIPSDGYNTTMKYLALYHLFPTWYRSMVEVTDRYNVQVLQNGVPVTYTIRAAKYDSIAHNGFLKETKHTQPLQFSVSEGIGKLTIHSFAQSDIKKGKQRFRPFISDAFQQLRKQSINNLVIDLRYNTGGSDANAAYFTRYFFDKPYRYWNRIEVTPAIAKAIKGMYTWFYRKPVKQDSIYLWRKARTAKDFNFYTLQKPAKKPYAGKVYVLINGFCMSSCADVTAVLSHNRKAVFIGEETGGGYQGNTSGMMPTTTATPANLRITVPLQKYVNAVDPAVNVGKGTLPDHPIVLSVDDILQQKDVAMQTVLDLIKKQRPVQP